MRVDDTPRLIGIILDQSFSFNAHIKHVKQSLSSWLWAISYNTCFLGLVETFIMNCFTHFSPLQDRLCCSSMAALALQHQHHQFRSSPKSGATFDNWATSFYSNQSPLSRIWCAKLLTISKHLIVWARNNFSTKQNSLTHCHLLQLLL